MKLLLPISLSLLLLLVSAHGQNRGFRTWTSRDGRKVEAVFTGFEAGQVALKLSTGQVVKVPLERLSEQDQTLVRTQPPPAPKREWPDLVLVPSASIEVKLASSDAATRKFVYRSEGFEYTSQGNLLPSLMNEVARTFEATKRLVGALPWGITCRPPEGMELYQAALYETRDDYIQAGGPTNSGGVYSTADKIFKIPFESLGIKRLGKSYTKDDHYSNDTLVHEITHQMMHDYLPYIPQWAVEGCAEYAELLPYNAGKFNVGRRREGLKDYLATWVQRGRPPVLPNLASLFRMTRPEWDALARESNIQQGLLYQQSALLVYYFNHLDGSGKGERWIAFMDATTKDVRAWAEYQRGFLTYREAMNAFFKLPGVERQEGGRFSYPPNLKPPQPPTPPDGEPMSDQTAFKHLPLLLDGRSVEALQAEIAARFKDDGFKL